MIAGCSISPIYYSYYCEPMSFWRNLFTWGISVSSGLVFFTSLWPEFDKPKYRVLRGTLFVVLGLYAIFPFTHMTYFVDKKYLPSFNPTLWLIGGFLYIFGATIYMLRIPEKHFPKKFDFFGHSH